MPFPEGQMDLDRVLCGVDLIRRTGPHLSVGGVEYDSRRAGGGSLFVAMQGGATDGNRYIAQAIEKSASAIITDSSHAFDLVARQHPEVAVVQVPNGRRALAALGANFFAHPERELKLSGVTGTNGKTTTAFLLEAMLRRQGRSTVLVGTIEYHVAGRSMAAPHTTPESRDLLEIFREGVDAGASEAVMEVSSHALDQDRVFGLTFDTAIFTNLTRDHLDYHGGMEQYFIAKSKLFDGSEGPAARVAVLNCDDEYGRRLRAIASSAGSSLIFTYGLHGGDFRASDVEMTASGMQFTLSSPIGEVRMGTRLTGRVNAYNLLAASAAAVARGLTLEQVAEGADSLVGVPGRFQSIDCGQNFAVIVDYAHTDDALKNVLSAAREFARQTGGRVIVLFGCGGDRDRSKRPLMGQAAGLASDMVVLTSDNPRSEDPEAIIHDVLPGLQAVRAKVMVEPDRARAIELAIGEARRGDLVLLAGKGHEKTQALRDRVIPFDDAEIARKVFEGQGKGGMKLELRDIARWTGGELRSKQNDLAAQRATGYSIDTRTLEAGNLFFAIRGERYDAHDFVSAAFERGACAAVIARSKAAQFLDVARLQNLILVADPLTALQTLAAAVRRQWNGRLIGITGSAGKTTTKEAIAEILGVRFRVLKSHGNLNNGFGLPLQLLKLQPEHEVAVIEMGMSRAGEIAALARIANPDWGVVTNVGSAHAENFPDGVAGIARAKYELIQSLPGQGIAFLCCDDPYVSQFGRDFYGRTVYFGSGPCADPRAVNILELGTQGVRFEAMAQEQRTAVAMNLLGRHNISNAMAAIAVGLHAGIPLEECAAAVGRLHPSDKRGKVLRLHGATIIDDCYNSNPEALKSMIATLAAMPAARRILVAGEMLELGAEAARLHCECGETAAEAGIDLILGVRGNAQYIVEGARKIGALASFVSSPREAGEWLRAELREGDAVLFKGSRGVGLEQALEQLF